MSSETERVLRGTPATLSVEFRVNETLTDPDDQAVTVSATNADGSEHTAAVPAIRQSVGVYTHPLVGQANLNELTFTWAAEIGGLDVSVLSVVEIVGGFFFTIEELRQYDEALRKQNPDLTYKHTYAELVRKRQLTEHEFEDICRRAFVPRFKREVITGDGTGTLALRRPEPIAVTKLVVDGVDCLPWVTSGDLRRDRDNPFLLVSKDNTFTEDADVEIEYEYGSLRPPQAIVEAAKQRTRGRVVAKDARIDERATKVEIDGFGTISLARPGIGKYQTGIPEIDEVLERNVLGSTGGVF